MVDYALTRSKIAAPPPIDLRDLKDRVDCREIVRLYWGQPKHATPQRDTYFSRWRNDGSKGSFCVTAYGYRDFGGAGEQGSVFDFLQRELNLSFTQAIAWLQDYTHSRPLAVTPRPQIVRPVANQPPSATWQTAAESFIAEAERQLWLREDILNYLRHERLLTDNVIQSARLGWNPTARKIAGQHWVEAGIVIPRYQDGSLWLINIRTVTGKFAEYLGIAPHRRHGETLDKYLCMAGSRLAGTLFNGNQLQPGKPVLFVEGELDCSLAQQEIGDLVTPVTLGGATNRLSPAWKQRILALNVPIYIALDNDAAGSDAAQHLIADLGNKALILKYPLGCKDFTDYLNAGGDARTWFNAQIHPAVFADGPPITWVSTLMNYMRPGAALLLVALQEAARTGAIDPERFTAPDLFRWMQANGYPIAKKTFYRYLEECNGELVSKCDIDSLTEMDRNSVLQSDTNPAGRPACVYRMVTTAQLEQTIRRQALARLYDRTFATDGKTGTKARPRTAGLTQLGIDNAEAVAAGLDKAYQSIYQRQGKAYLKAEKRIERTCAALRVELADRTPLKIEGHLIQRQSDLEICIIKARLQEDRPTSQKEIAHWIGKDRSRVGAVMTQAGYQGVEQPRQVIPVKPGQNIKKAAYNVCPNGRWVGLLIDDQPEMQPFEQERANNAVKSVALVLKPPYAYKYVGVPVEPPQKPAAKPKDQSIETKPSSAPPPYKPTPYFGDDVNPEVDYNQLILGLTLDGWVYEAQTGFWYHAASAYYCRTVGEAVLMQAGEPVESATQKTG